jgi:hypothetical protein
MPAPNRLSVLDLMLGRSYWIILVLRGKAPASFVSQELRLDFKPAGKASQRAICANNAMTGHDDRQRILTIGGADCADRLGGADALGQIEITPGLPVGDLPQRPPDLLLKFGSSRLERKIELISCAGEIFF